MDHLLVINSGSSSLKYDVFAPWSTTSSLSRVAAGVVERIGHSDTQVVHRQADAPGEPAVRRRVGDQSHASDHASDHAAALHAALTLMAQEGPTLDRLAAVGHRVVHGGPRLLHPVVVDGDVEAAIEQAAVLAPLHNPAALAGIRAVRSTWPGVPQVAVFDTAFHRTLPPAAATYAVPPELAQRHLVRRWGFHGISHEYVTRRSAQELGVRLDKVNLVVCHIGNGVSVTAVRGGRSVDTSMGFTPLEGAVMGTRSGDLDPAAIFHLLRETGWAAPDIERLLLHDSGLQGLCGESDMRRVRARAAEGDAAAQLALQVYTHRLRRYVAAYLGEVPQLHALAFTAGVGENDPATRAEVVEPLAHLGLRLDPAANEDTVGPSLPVRIDAGDGPAVLVVPTDEAAEIARQSRSALLGPVAQ